MPLKSKNSLQDIITLKKKKKKTSALNLWPIQSSEPPELNSPLSVWLLVITTAIQNSSVSQPSICHSISCTFQRVKREQHFSAHLPAGTEHNAAVVQQAYVKKWEIDKGYTYMNLPLCVSWQQVNLKNTWTDECDSLVPSPVKGRLPLTRATDGTGGDGWDRQDVMDDGRDELGYEGKADQ